MDEESIHGNCVVHQQCGLLILGAPNSGKSTLSYCLIQQHYFSLISDDLVVLTKSAGSPIIGRLSNLNYLGWLHLKEKGFVYVNNAQTQSKITHIIYLSRDDETNEYTTILRQKITIKKVNMQQRTSQQCADLFINNSLDFCILSS